MAVMKSGDHGECFETVAEVCGPDPGGCDPGGNIDISLICRSKDRGEQTVVTLSRNEALKLCAALATRIAMVADFKRPEP